MPHGHRHAMFHNTTASDMRLWLSECLVTTHGLHCDLIARQMEFGRLQRVLCLLKTGLAEQARGQDLPYTYPACVAKDP